MGQDDVQHGHEDQQEREQGGEPVVGDERGEVAGLVVPELLPDGPALLQPVERGDQLFHGIHRA
ncbi:MAG: hypothetical protein ABR926_10115 [Streptosporangiaceae bacterium]